MARVNMTKQEIIGVASKFFLEKGYSETSPKMICEELGISTGNLTYYFPTKEHLLAEVVKLLCGFQYEAMVKEANDGVSEVLAVCLEFATMTAASETDAVIKDFFLACYSNPICLDIIRKNDAERAKKVFAEYRPDWSDAQFAEAEILVSGIEFATLMTTDNSVDIETRIIGALNNILGIYGVPEEIRKIKIGKVFSMNYKELGKSALAEFKDYVNKTNEQIFKEMLKEITGVRL